MSVVFIKYLPELGRDYDPWTGWAFYTGVTTNKNMLGYLLFVFGLLFAVFAHRKIRPQPRRQQARLKQELPSSSWHHRVAVHDGGQQDTADVPTASPC